MSEEKRILILEPDPTDAEIISMQIRKPGIPLNTRRVGTRDMFDGIMAKAIGQVDQRSLPAADNPFKRGNVARQHSVDIGLIVARAHSGHRLRR